MARPTRDTYGVTVDWEGGQHQGLRWRRIGVVLLTLVLVASGAYALRREQRLSVESDDAPIVGVSETVEVIATPPLRAGDLWYCPSTHPVRVYDDGRYYPQEYPQTGRVIARPDNCFEDTERAEEGGYELAPPPPGAVIAGGVYLVPTVQPTTRLCALPARTVGVPVPCPGLLPAPAEATSCMNDSCIHRRGVIIEQRSFQVPKDWPATQDQHVVLTAAPVAGGQIIRPGRRLRVAADSALVRCSQDAPVRPRGQRWFLRCSSSPPWIPGLGGFPHESHMAVFWLRDRVVYGASVEGWSPESIAVLKAVVKSIRYVEPPAAG